MGRPQLIYTTLLIGLPCLLVCGGCSLQQPSREQRIGNLGYFKFRLPNNHMKGVIIDSALSDSWIPKIAIDIEPLEKISWRVSGPGANFDDVTSGIDARTRSRTSR